MSETTKLSIIWLVSALFLSIIVNSVAVISRAHSEPGDPRDYTASTFQEVRTSHGRRHRAGRVKHRPIVRDATPSLASLVHRQAEQIEQMKRELAEIRREFRPGPAVQSEAPAPQQQNAVAVASLIELPKEAEPAKTEAGPVMPATATQRGQWNDRRRTHRHAGIDLGGDYGSPIVASYAGKVLPPPGGDRGYGPHCMVIQGDDGLVYRYAHMASVKVKIGERVKTGQPIGTMGKVGRHGFTHLHFEMMRVADYRRRPYGVHSLDPNDYLGGGRGKRMIAGSLMTGQSAVATAKLGQ